MNELYYDDLDLDPRLRQVVQTSLDVAQRPSSPPRLNLSSLLDFIARVRRTPEGITVGPGRLEDILRTIRQKWMFAPTRVGQTAYDAIRSALDRLEITPTGEVMLRTRPRQAELPLEVPPRQRQFIPRPQWPVHIPPPPEPQPQPQRRPPIVAPPVVPPPEPSMPELPALTPPLAEDIQPPMPTPPSVEPPAKPKATLSEEWLSRIEALARPWEPKTDFEKELYRLLDELTQAYATKPALEDPSGPRSFKEFLAEFPKYLAITVLGKDPFEFKRLEQEQQRKIAEKERAEMLSLATQLFNTKLSALTERVRQEEAERQARAKHLETLGNLYPNIRSQPAYLAAINAILGIPQTETMEFIRAHTDPETGLLKGLYLSPTEQVVERMKAEFKAKEDVLVDAGIPREEARVAAVFGTYDPLKIALSNYHKALTTGDPRKIAEAAQRYALLKEATTVDPEREMAVAFITRYQENPKAMRESLRPLFKTDKAIDSFIAYKAALAYGAKGWKAPEEKDISFNESIVRQAYEIMQRKDPDAIKRFTDTIGLHPVEVIKESIVKGKEPETITTEEPMATIKSLFPRATIDQVAGLFVPGNPLAGIIDETIRNRYKATFAEVEAKLPKNAPLSSREMYRIASLLNAGKQKEALEYIKNLWAGKRE